MEDLPSGFALDQMVHKAQKMEDRTIRRWRMAHTTIKVRGPVDKRRRIRCCGKQRLKRGVISLFHDSTTAGHPGITKP